MLAITIDVDWAPDCAIDEAADILLSCGANATWFITHESPAVDRLREHPDQFVLGIHPNFNPGSSHGSTIDDVIDFAMSLVPDAHIMRTHGLFQSSEMYRRIIETTPIRIDVSVSMHRVPNLRPYWHPFEGGRLIRIPYYWEDADELTIPESALVTWPLIKAESVLNFHPLHIALNSTSTDAYLELRDRGPINGATAEEIAALRDPGVGIETLFTGVATELGRRGGGGTLDDFAETLS